MRGFTPVVDLDGEPYTAAEMKRLTVDNPHGSKSLERLKKVLVYVTRKDAGRHELLVFEHRDHPDAGLQVPAGSIDPSESAVGAAGRELLEESGLSGLSLRGRIDVYEWLNPQTSRLHRRHVYHFVTTRELPDAWAHTVSGGEEDSGMVFLFRWIPIEGAQRKLAGEQGLSVGRLP